MKKILASGAVLSSLVIGGYMIHNHQSPDRDITVPVANSDARFIEAIPGNSQGKEGWTFIYHLCVPMPLPAACQIREKGIFVSKGTEAVGMPYLKRSVDIETVEQARLEADAAADIIENIHK